MANGKETAKKSKGQAIALAIAFGFWGWLYTYQKNKVSFWVSLVLCCITFGLFTPVAWLWIVVARLASKSELYLDSSANFTSSKRTFLWVICWICLIFWAACVVWIITLNYNDAKARQARHLQLTADPINSQAMYNALNKKRSESGASALAALPQLESAASQKCNDMSANKYLEYKNPTTGKDANSYITDNEGDLYFKTYVSSIMAGTSQQTATELITQALAQQSTNLNNPEYNSIGWATCPGTDNTIYVVAMLANKQDKPVTPQVNNYYSAPSSYAPIYRPSVSCTTRLNSFMSTLSTTCY